jgi:hypothetical protein
MTKRAFLARLLKGPIAIEPVADVRWYRVSIAGDPSPQRGVLIALVPEYDYILEDYDTDHAHLDLDGKEYRLTRREADAIAARLRRLVRLRGGAGRRSDRKNDAVSHIAAGSPLPQVRDGVRRKRFRA